MKNIHLTVAATLIAFAAIQGSAQADDKDGSSSTHESGISDPYDAPGILTTAQGTSPLWDCIDELTAEGVSFDVAFDFCFDVTAPTGPAQSQQPGLIAGN